MYTKNQKKLLQHAKLFARELFRRHPAPAHEFDHSLRVARAAAQIGRYEGANVFLCELAALLHDIGRTREAQVARPQPNTHHELSYQMCRQLLRRDPEFAVLAHRDKVVLLYAVRYHWNNAADKYLEAVVLRDADKLDTLGSIGIRRTHQFHRSRAAVLDDFRLKYDCWYWLITPLARKIAKTRRLLAPVDRHYSKLLRQEIRPVAL